jgi:hypothetical protein
VCFHLRCVIVVVQQPCYGQRCPSIKTYGMKSRVVEVCELATCDD